MKESTAKIEIEIFLEKFLIQNEKEKKKTEKSNRSFQLLNFFVVDAAVV